MSDYELPSVFTDKRSGELKLMVDTGQSQFYIAAPRDRAGRLPERFTDAFRLFASAPEMYRVMGEHKEGWWCNTMATYISRDAECSGGPHRRVYLIDADAADAVMKRVRGE